VNLVLQLVLSGSGITGSVAGTSAATAGAAATGAAAELAPVAKVASAPVASSAPWTASSTGLNVLASEAAPAASKGILGSIMNSPYTAPALISGGTQLAGGLIQGYGAQKQYEDQKQLDADARKRYNQNIGVNLNIPKFG